MKHLKKEMQAISEACEVKAIYSKKVKASERPQILRAEDSVKLLYSFFDALQSIEQRETFLCMFMDRSNKVLSIAKICEGTATSCIVDIQYIMRLAILQNAQAIILCHNHPSGNMNPSDADREITKRVDKAGELLSVKLLDHIILSGEGNEFYSFANEGLI